MKLKDKLRKLSVKIDCIVNFNTDYLKNGKSIELLESLSQEELDRKVIGTLYSVYRDGKKEMKIMVN